MKKIITKVIFLLGVWGLSINAQTVLIKPVEFFFLTSKSSFLPGEKLEFSVNGSMDSACTFSFKLLKVNSPDSFYISQLPDNSYRTSSLKRSISYEFLETDLSWEEKVNLSQEDNDTVSTDIKTDISLEPGLYVLQASTETRSAYISFLVSRYGLILKAIEKKYLCVVTDLVTGEIILNCNLNFYYHKTFVFSMNTGETGVLFESFPDSLLERINSKEISIVGNVNDNLIICRPQLEVYNSKLIKMFSIKNKELYEYGDTLNFTAILREITPDGVFLPSVDSIFTDLEYYDTAKTKHPLILNEYGVVKQNKYINPVHPAWYFDNNLAVNDDQFIWDDNPATIKTERESHDKLFVITERNLYRQGETISGKIKYANTNSTGLRNKLIRISMSRTLYKLPWWIDDEFSSIFRYESGEEFVTYYPEYNLETIDAQLDEEGEYEFEYTPPMSDYDFNYLIHIQLLDDRKFKLYGSKNVFVSTGESIASFYSDKKNYLPGEKILIKIKIKGLNRVNRSFPYKLSVNNLEYQDSKLIDGLECFYSEGITNEIGFAEVEFTPSMINNIGYTATLKIGDDDENVFEEKIKITVQSASAENKNEFQIYTDKDYYLPGDTMNLWIDFPGALKNYLLTFERGKIIDQKIIAGLSGRQFYRITLDDKYSPDFFINVYGTYDDEYFHKDKLVRIIPQNKFLRLNIETDDDNYVVNDEVSGQIKVTELTNNPVSEANVMIVVKNKPDPYLGAYGPFTIYDAFHSSLTTNLYYNKITKGADRSIQFNRSSRLKGFEDMHPNQSGKTKDAYKVVVSFINYSHRDDFLDSGPSIKFIGRDGEIFSTKKPDAYNDLHASTEFRLVNEGYYDVYGWGGADIRRIFRSVFSPDTLYNLYHHIGSYYIKSDTTIIVDFDDKSEWSIRFVENEKQQVDTTYHPGYSFNFKYENIFDESFGIFDTQNRNQNQYCAYYETNLISDKNGMVLFDFTVPDKKADWYIYAYAVTKDSKVGEKIIPLKMKPPHFMVR